MFQSKYIFLLSVLLLVACAQKERAGDITLATPASQSTPVALVNNQQSGSSQSSQGAIIAGTNLTSAYGGTQASGAISKTSEPGIRLPVATSTPVAAPITINNSEIASAPASTSNSNTSTNQNSEANNSNTSSSNQVQNSKIPARVITIVRTKPDCSSADCPTIKVKRLSFVGRDRFNNFLDQTLASMAETDTSNNAAFRSLSEFATYFWKTSKPGYQVVLEASVIRGDEELVVVQLDSFIFTGGAHGLSTTQYINWLPKTDKILSLESMLLPKKMPAYEQALKKQHALWLKSNKDALENPAAYNKLWPFVPTDNAALLPEGLAVTYDPYTIAPYYFGRPTITIPYSDLAGILRPELLPKAD